MLPEIEPAHALLLGLLGAAFLLYKHKYQGRARLTDIPTVGPSWPLLSYIGAYRFQNYAKAMLQEGYNNYNGRAFKIAQFDQWIVVLSGSKLIEEFLKAPDAQLSAFHAGHETLQLDYTLPIARKDPHHLHSIISHLTRNLGVLFPDMRDELVSAFEDSIPTSGDAWTKVPVYHSLLRIVARTSNRIFVGLPKCRNDDFLKLSVQFTKEVIDTSQIIRLFPRILWPIAGWIFTPASLDSRIMAHLQPIIAERLKNMEEGGQKWPDKSKDILDCLLKESLDREYSIETVAPILLALEFAAIHTTSTAFTHSLYHLAENPHFADVLREEIQDVVGREGWTKSALGKMRKVDSFLKESQRINGMGELGVHRKALMDYTFSDGTTIPAGTLLAIPTSHAHFDEAQFPDADVFSPFRFSDMREEEGEAAKNQFISISKNMHTFGHGRHACPGRFFAANELKALLAHVVMTYDVKFEDGQARPKNRCSGIIIMPHPTAEIMFRKRV